MKAKKSLGQHFLKSQSALSAIIDTGDVHTLDIVLEIGPGEGTLTERLLRLAGKVIAVEKDRRLIPLLQEKFKKEIASKQLTLTHADILKFNMSRTVLDIKKYKVIANIPYYITGQVLRMFLETKNQPEEMVLLVQKEVAERIVARNKKPFDSAQGKESLLSLSVKAFGKPKIIRTVGKGAFSPQPKVDSAILLISDISRKKFAGLDLPARAGEKFFFKIIRAGFAHKRKQLLSNLSDLYQKEILIKTFKKCGINIKARAEDIGLERWVKLCKNLLTGIK